MQKKKEGKWKAALFYFAIAIVIALTPFLTELIIRKGPYRDSFDNDVWFSFMGSYLGAIITVIIFALTLYFNKMDMKKENEKNNKNAIIKQELELAKKVYDFFALNDYNMHNIQTELAEYGRYCSEILVINSYIERGKKVETQYEDINRVMRKFYSYLDSLNFKNTFQVQVMMFGLAKLTDQEEKLQHFTENILKLRKFRNDIAVELTENYLSFVDELINEM